MGGAGVEGAIGAAGQTRDFPKRARGIGIVALLEHERLDAGDRQFARFRQQAVDVLLHRVADEDQRPDLGAPRLVARMAQHLADLRRAAAHFDFAHQIAEPLPARDEFRGAAFVEAAEIDELHVEPAEVGGDLKHPRLQALGEIPGRLPAHRRVEREDQPAAPDATGAGALRAASTKAAISGRSTFVCASGVSFVVLGQAQAPRAMSASR